MSDSEQVYVDFVSNWLWTHRDFNEDWKRKHNCEKVSIDQFREELSSDPQFIKDWSKFQWNTDVLSGVNSQGELDWWKNNNTLQSALKQLNVIVTEAPLEGTGVAKSIEFAGRATTAKNKKRNEVQAAALAETIRQTAAQFITAYSTSQGLELNTAIKNVDILLKQLQQPDSQRAAALMLLKLLNAFEPLADTETSIEVLQLAKTQCNDFLN
jgi:hypothetical protein